MVPEKPEPNAYWHEKHGWITGLPSVNDPDYSKELNAKVKGLDKGVKDLQKRDRSGPRIASKMMTDPDLRNTYTDTNKEGDVINQADYESDFDTCNTGGRSGSFTHGNRGCGCRGC